jgi:molybdopterin/thiamine biosynthesis adenylyltransferase
LTVTIELSDSERARYRDQIEGDLGLDGQGRLKQARAIVIGAGAAGSAAATELASCGVGYVAVVDGAQVALGDLAGQAIYYTPDVGESKADTLAAKLGLLNPEVQVDSYPVHLDAQNAAAIVAGHDIVLDCTRDRGAAGALAAAGGPEGQIPPALSPSVAAGAALARAALRTLSREPARALR